MAFEQPLNLYNLFVNVIAGNIEIFTFISILIISALAARFNMPKSIFLIMLFLFAVLLADSVGGFFLIAVVLLSFFLYTAVGNLFR